MSTVSSTVYELTSVLRRACEAAGVDATGAEAIRVGENAIYRLPGGVVARVARPGQATTASKEVAVARWLSTEGVAAVEAVDLAQPVLVDERAVTFWRELPEHRHGSLREVALVLRQLHSCTLPTTFELPELSPFVRLAERIDGATTLSDEDRTWLRGRLDHLREAYIALPPGLAPAVIHGDAWAGNVVATDDGRVVLLDLERCSIGRPEWDLVSTAVRYSSFGTMDAEEYSAFARAYGHDVLRWPGFEVLRDIRELRVTCYAAQRATEDTAARPEAAKRVASLRGENGVRPWTDWHALP